MESGYLWGGTLAGLALLVALGTVLATRSAVFRASLSRYVGEEPARWFLYAAWSAYGYGLVYAASQAYFPMLESTGAEAPPSVVAFLYGVFGRSVLWFFGAVVPVIQVIVLVAVGVLLFRHLRHAESDQGHKT